MTSEKKGIEINFKPYFSFRSYCSAYSHRCSWRSWAIVTTRLPTRTSQSQRSDLAKTRITALLFINKTAMYTFHLFITIVYMRTQLHHRSLTIRIVKWNFSKRIHLQHFLDSISCEMLVLILVCAAIVVGGAITWRIVIKPWLRARSSKCSNVFISEIKERTRVFISMLIKWWCVVSSHHVMDEVRNPGLKKRKKSLKNRIEFCFLKIRMMRYYSLFHLIICKLNFEDSCIINFRAIFVEHFVLLI